MLTVAGSVVDAARQAAICDAYGIADLELFGSAARGAAGPTSNIDILYTPKPG